MRGMFVCQTIVGVYPACHCGSCSFFDSTSSSRVPFTPATVNSPSTPVMLTLALSSLSSTPTPSSSTSDSATSNLTPSSSAHYEPFHANPLLTHTNEMSAFALLVINNLRVVEAFFKGIREVLDGSGHTDDMGVDGDHVGIVDGDSASEDANLDRLDDHQENIQLYFGDLDFDARNF